MKSGVSPQKYRWQTPIWASICTPPAPNLLISSEHSLRLGKHNFRLGGTSSSHLEGHDPEMPPAAPGLYHSKIPSVQELLYSIWHIRTQLPVGYYRVKKLLDTRNY